MTLVPTYVSVALFAAALFGLAVLALQHAAVVLHLRRGVPRPGRTPGVSILKPLCGLDDGLDANLATFEALDYPRYEVLLGVGSADDAALPHALAAARRRPDLFRVVVQRGAPGLNPKVNQLVTLAGAARHPVLVVSDSNVAVPPAYLLEVAALLEDPEVGLVTHPIVGVGGRRLGSLFDNVQLTTSVAAGMIAAQRVARHDVVVGKSMALRAADLAALGGFESVKDVLAEDYVLGRRVRRVLGKRVAVARLPIENVSRDRTLREFWGRFRRWSVIQRHAVGRTIYAGQAFLNPTIPALLGALVAPSRETALALALVLSGKLALDAVALRAWRPRELRWRALALVPAKDLVLCAAWTHGLVGRHVVWRGRRMRVLPGTRLAG